MENQTNAELSRQIETVAQTVAKIYERMATKEETNKRFDALEQGLDRIEKGYGYRIANIERDVAALKT